MNLWRAPTVLLLMLACAVMPAAAHEIRAGYFGLSDAGGGSYTAVWKAPSIANQQLDIRPVLPEGCQIDPQMAQSTAAGEYIESWRVTCPDGLAGKPVRFDGLSLHDVDILFRLETAPGEEWTQRATRANPVVAIPAEPVQGGVLATYFVLGVEHILIGLDHLLFVLCLIYLIPDLRRLALTITAFTLAHSVTLATSVLGWIALPVKPVEATIALSIVFLASEVLAARSGGMRLSQRAPWLVAFPFGLLHGLGFAAVLTDIGLPSEAIPLSLLGFNLGVEAGQLLFVGAVLLGLQVLRRLRLETQFRLASVYLTGALATNWLIERML